MATTEEASPALTYQTWVLKVSIHCEGCKRKVKKVLQTIDGVYTIMIDSKQHKVTVNGDIDAETVIKKLVKNGKQAELWPENKEKEPEEQEVTGGKNNEKEETKNSENGGSEAEKKNKENSEGKPAVNRQSKESKPSPTQAPIAGKGGSGKKKKKKGKKGNNTNSNVQTPVGQKSTGSSQPSQQLYSHVPYPEPVYSVSYHKAYPRTTYAASYYTAPDAYTSESYSSTSPDSYHVFSDENPNGCSVM
ncbi:uncharacterized protein LOC143883832 [Tasmannia lanceolata]|uniref:uncharacterized protein LOC143883832 n=1 Tax=Tasmannia lanceolata TaxID=3420 RepID=UPI0040637977